MARRPAREKGKTLDRIRAAAFRLFGRFGYDGVSMLTVARDSDITKAALYWHYENKESLYADCMRQLIGLFETHVFAPAGRERDPTERVLALFRGMQHLGSDARIAHGIAGYWLRPSTAAVDDARHMQAAFEERSESAVETIIEQAQAAGALHMDGATTRDMGRAFTAIVEAIVLPLRGHSAAEQNHLVAVLARIFFKAHASSPELVERAHRLLTQSNHPSERGTLKSEAYV